MGKSDLVSQDSLLKLTDSIEGFLLKLLGMADVMSVVERQKVLGLVVREILIDDKNILVKHSIPLPHSNMPRAAIESSKVPSYLLGKGSHVAASGQHSS